MRGRASVAVLAAALSMPVALWAQDGSFNPQTLTPFSAGQAELPGDPRRAPILTIDQDALYAGSAWGRRAQAELEAEAGTLSAENDRIAAELTREEHDLTEARKTLSPEAFAPLADAFDEKAQTARRSALEKARALSRRADLERRAFIDASLPVFGALMRERDAQVVLDRRSVLVSLEAVDVTDEMIQGLDAALGDGTGWPRDENGVPLVDPAAIPGGAGDMPDVVAPNGERPSDGTIAPLIAPMPLPVDTPDQ